MFLKGSHAHSLRLRGTHHLHGVAQVALDFVQHVFAAAPEQHRARLGVCALRQEGKVVVAELHDLRAWGQSREGVQGLRGQRVLSGGLGVGAASAPTPSGTLKRPQPVPTSDGWISSARDTMVAPHALAMRFWSVFRMRRNTVMFAWPPKRTNTRT